MFSQVSPSAIFLSARRSGLSRNIIVCVFGVFYFMLRMGRSGLLTWLSWQAKQQQQQQQTALVDFLETCPALSKFCCLLTRGGKAKKKALGWMGLDCLSVRNYCPSVLFSLPILPACHPFTVSFPSLSSLMHEHDINDIDKKR